MKALAVALLLASTVSSQGIGTCTASSAASPCYPGGLAVVFTTGDSGSIGSFIKFNAYGTLVGGSAPTLIAVASQIWGVPIQIGPGFTGDLLLDPTDLVVFTPGISPQYPGVVATDIWIPNDPLLIGQSLHGQRVQLDLATGDWNLSYAWGFDILP